MKTRLNIKNFRIFDEDGAVFELNPITILTGCNSSGKSSMVKAVMLLNSFLSQIKKDIENGNEVDLMKYKLDFTQYPMNLLGRFDKVVNNKSESKKITLEYTAYSLIISKDVDVKLVFSANENDDLNNGYLENITISIDGEMFYYSDKETNKSECDLSIIKEQSVDFLIIQYLLYCLDGLESSYCFDHKLTKTEYEKNRNEIFSGISAEYSNKRSDDIKTFLRSLRNKDTKNFLKKIESPILDWTKEHDSVFMIPIIERLDKINKSDIWSVIKDEFIKDFDDLEVPMYHKIFHDYMESDYDLFSDYFKSYETKFLECHDYELLKLFHKHPSHIEISYFDFLQLERVEDGCFVFSRHGVGSIQENLLEESLSFETLYGFIMLLNDKYCKDDNNFYEIENTPLKYPHHRHKMYNYLCNVAKLLFEEIVTPEWCGRMEYVSSSRTKISRLYSLDSKDDFTDLLKRYFEAKRKFGKNKEYTVLDFTNKWINNFGIGSKLSLNYDDEGLGTTIRLYKTDGEDHLLADEGYGITQLVSVLLQIEYLILLSKGTKIHTICIEEPEIHLHPKYQSLLADMFVEAYQKYNIHFIIETHSEYLIRKLQTIVASKKKNLLSEDVSLYYIASNDKCDEYDNYEQIRKINIKKDGRLESPFGRGFFDEADNLAMELLKFKL